MPRHPRLILAALAATALSAGSLQAETLFGDRWPESGGWGQAWGEDAPPAAHSQPGQTLPPVPTGHGATVFGQSWPEVGGWGNAWGDDEAPAPAPRNRPPATAVATATQPAPPSAVQGSAPAAVSPPPPTAQAAEPRVEPSRAVPDGMRKGKPGSGEVWR